MGHHEKLCKIDIPKARAGILKSIAEYRRHAILAELVEGFLKGLEGKRIDARCKDKLQELLQEAAPSLKVYRVTYSKEQNLLTLLPDYRFNIWMYDMDVAERHFLVRHKPDGTLNIEDAMVADRQWAAHADLLEARLPKFTYHATRFNEAVDMLKKQCEFALDSDGKFPVYPLSEYFHWYQLSSS